MSSLLRSRRRAISGFVQRTRLFVERLEDRDCPSAPMLSNFTVTPTTGTTVQVSGQVADANPASVQITLGGVMSGSTTANAQGTFTITAQASGLGTVTASGVDGQGLTSNTVEGQVTSQNPVIQNLAVSYGAERTVTLTGQVSDETPGGRTVTFTGVVTGTVTTNANGTFSYTTTASGLGNVQAITIDPWGLTSAAAQLTLTRDAPVITSFQIVQQYGTTWVVSGHVQDASPSGLVVVLGGLPCLQGVNAPVDGLGNFNIEVTIPVAQEGMTATADVTNWWGLAAAQDWYVVG
jgi:hypothetical protein